MEKRIAFVNKIEAQAGEKLKVGQKLLVIVEQLDEIDKATIIGNLFCSTINEQIKYEDFLRLSTMVQKAFLPDLLKLKQSPFAPSPNDSRENLYNVGLLSVKITEDRFQNVDAFGRNEIKSRRVIFSYDTNKWYRLLRKYGFRSSILY